MSGKVTKPHQHTHTASKYCKVFSSKHNLCLSLQIIFYEERNFQGRSYECVSDCSEITSHLSRCSSCRVESGAFMVYDQPNFTGQQYLLTRGEYPEYQNTIGFDDCIQSCRFVPVVNIKSS